MNEPATLPVAAEPTFADYVRQQNAAERNETDGPADPAPVTPPEDAAAGAQDPQTTGTAPEPVEPQAESERNADGTFKPKSDKVTAKGEWKRNQELTARLRETERQLEQARAARQVDDVNAPRVPVDPSDPEPTIDQFLDKPDPYAALAVAAGKWAVRQDRRDSARQQSEHAVRSRVETFAETHPDYQEKIQSISDVIFQPEVLQALSDDDLGPAVAYHLASHPEEARRIAALRPLEGVKAIGKLLTRLEPATVGSGPQTVPVSKAKPLIKPVSAAPTASDPSPPDDLPFGRRYIAEMNRKERKETEALRG